MRPFELTLPMLFLSASALATPQTLDPVRLAEEFPALNVFDLDPAKPLPRKGGLLELKWRELRKEYPACLKLAAKLQASAKDLDGWIARVRLECAMGAFADDKKDAAAVGAAFDSVKPALLREGAWKDALRESWARAGQLAAEQSLKAKPAEAVRRAEALLDSSDLLSRDQRAAALAILADVALAKKDDAQALFFLRQALDLGANPTIQGKIADIEARRSPTKREAEVAAPEAPETGAEADADAEVRRALDEDRREDAVRRMVETLNRFPNGKNARRYRDRILEMMLAAAERDRREGTDEAARIRAVASTADASRLAEWAQVAHRRGDDRCALEIAEKALESLSMSPDAAKLHWVAGRSALFLGEFERASRHFDRVAQFHSTSEEVSESLFRLGLLQIRDGRWSAAARVFDKVVAQDKARWDLGARYWRVRALEKSDPPKAAVERDALIKRYPFTYYGLRLKAERDGGFLEFPKNDRSPLEASPARLWLAGAQKKAWERFKKLSAEGWVLEAQAELSQLPAPQDPWSMLQWARTLARAGQFPAAIVLVNKATENEETLRHPRYISDVYPRAYGRWIEREAGVHAVDPVLVRSLVRQESAFGLRAVSTSNALGLMQLIPPTAREVAGELKMKVAIPDDLFRPEVNVPMGTYYLAKMLKEFEGNVPLALAAYNAGPHRISRWIRQRPDLAELKGKTFSSWQDEIWYDELPWSETSFYVKAILRNALLDRLIDQGRVPVTPGFWSEMRQVAGPKSDDEVKRR